MPPVNVEALEGAGGVKFGLNAQAVREMINNGFVFVAVFVAWRAEVPSQIGFRCRPGEFFARGEARRAVAQTRVFWVVGVGRDKERDMVEPVLAMKLKFQPEVRIKQCRGVGRNAFVAIRTAEDASVVERSAEAQGAETSIGEIENQGEVGRLGPVREERFVTYSQETEEGCEHGYGFER